MVRVGIRANWLRCFGMITTERVRSHENGRKRPALHKRWNEMRRHTVVFLEITNFFPSHYFLAWEYTRRAPPNYCSTKGLESLFDKYFYSYLIEFVCIATYCNTHVCHITRRIIICFIILVSTAIINYIVIVYL